MQLHNVVFSDNFAEELTTFLNEKYANLKVLFISSELLLNQYDDRLQTVYKSKSLVKTCLLPEYAVNKQVFRRLVEGQLVDDVKALIVFGGGGFCDLVKMVATNYNLPYIIIPSACSGGGYLLNSCLQFDDELISKTSINAYELCLVDKRILAKTPYKLIGACYGEIISNFVTILDLAFNKSIYSKSVDVELLVRLEQYIKQAVMLPSSVIKTYNGLVSLFTIMLKCEACLNMLQINFSSVQSVSLVLHKLLNHKLLFGETLLISSVFLINLFHNLFNVSFINCNFLPNLEVRCKKLNAILNYKDIDFISYISTGDKDNLAYKFMSTKKGMLKVAGNYLSNINNAFESYKNLHNDKAVWVNKIVGKQSILNAVSLAPDIYCDFNLLNFMRNFGLLDF